MKLDDLITAIPRCRVKGRRDVEVTGITLCSQMARDGYLFAAIPGSRYDGHDFVEEARHRGAVAALVQRDIPNGNGITIIGVEDTRQSLAALADCFYDSPSKGIEVIGVTGTNGKTTVCYLLYETLKAAGRSPALFGTIEYLVGERSIPAERTTPESPYLQWMLRKAVDEGCDCLVMEVSSHALAQQRVACVNFDTAVFTNLGNEHLDFHGSREDYFKAKSLLFKVPELKLAVVNADDGYGRDIEVSEGATLVTYGMSEAAMVRTVSVEAEPNGSRFEIGGQLGRLSVDLPLLGRHNVYNALAAVSVALSMGVSADTVASVLAGTKAVPGRLEEVVKSRPYRVFIDYAHTEEALRNVLSALRGVCKGRVILVFGCGGDRDRNKRLPMGRVAAQLADFTFVTSDNPRGEDPLEIIAEIVRGFSGNEEKYTEVPDRREAIASALAAAEQRDIVLIAGKGHERTQDLGSTVVSFNDREVVEEIVGVHTP